MYAVIYPAPVKRYYFISKMVLLYPFLKPGSWILEKGLFENFKLIHKSLKKHLNGSYSKLNNRLKWKIFQSQNIRRKSFSKILKIYIILGLNFFKTGFECALNLVIKLSWKI